MQEKIKEIAAFFLKQNQSLLKEDTPIDARTFGSSIMVHRFYAVLKRDLKIQISDYGTIATLGDLLRMAPQAGSSSGYSIEVKKPLHSMKPALPLPMSVGIDLEDIDHLPKVEKYKEDPFYQQNFSNAEIEYCTGKSNPRESFAGLFAVKEAVIKADPAYKSRSFNSIEINHDADGRPILGNFLVSISHASNQVVAIAIKMGA